MDFPIFLQAVSEIDLNYAVLFFLCQKSTKRRKTNPPLCPKIIPLDAQERAMIPLVV
jgi:hypothetical protein